MFIHKDWNCKKPISVQLRSLPEKCRSCLLHGDSDSFEDLKRVALKFGCNNGFGQKGVGGKLSPFQPNPKGKVASGYLLDKSPVSGIFQLRNPILSRFINYPL